MSIPEVKITVLKNLLIFGEKYLPQSVRLLEGRGVETLFGRMLFEHAVSEMKYGNHFDKNVVDDFLPAQEKYSCDEDGVDDDR